MDNRDPMYGRSTSSGRDILDEMNREGSTSGQADTADQAKDKAQQAAGTAKEKGQEALSKGQDAAETAKEKAGEMTGKAQAGADQGMDKAASGLDQAADMLRDKGDQQGGSIASATARTADTLETASAYLREKDTDQLLNDLEALVRSKPTESLLVAAGIGFVLSKILK